MADKSVIASLESRVRQLIGDHRRLQGLCAELDRTVGSLRAENRALRERLREQEDALARAELTEGLAGESRNREKARARVNRLMREVDKCIALLRSPAEGPSDRTGDQR